MSEPGLFDLLNPLFAMIDRLLAQQLGLSALWRIAVFAAIAAFFSMFVYRFLSNQTRIEQLKGQIRGVQAKLAQSDLPPGDLRKAIKQNLVFTARQLLLSFWPAALASMPVVFLLAFCSNQFSYLDPRAGDRLYVTPIAMQDSPAGYLWKGSNVQWDARRQAWTLYYDPDPQGLSLSYSGETQLTLPTAVPTGVIHKKRWWNRLIANPAGYLPDSNRIERFDFSVPEQVIIDWGPAWMRGWIFAFIVFLLLFSIIIKKVWRIH